MTLGERPPGVLWTGAEAAVVQFPQLHGRGGGEGCNDGCGQRGRRSREGGGKRSACHKHPTSSSFSEKGLSAVRKATVHTETCQYGCIWTKVR